MNITTALTRCRRCKRTQKHGSRHYRHLCPNLLLPLLLLLLLLSTPLYSLQLKRKQKNKGSDQKEKTDRQSKHAILKFSLTRKKTKEKLSVNEPKSPILLAPKAC
jgi:hypothetical protein